MAHIRYPAPFKRRSSWLISLGLLDVTYLKKNEWCFEIRGKKIDRLDWFKVILEMLQLSQEHRNEVWRGNYPNASQLAFRLGFHDIFYAKAMIGIPTSVEEEMIWSYYVDDMKHSRDWSAKNVCIMQMEDLELDISKMSKKNSYKKLLQRGASFCQKLTSEKKQLNNVCGQTCFGDPITTQFGWFDIRLASVVL